MVLTSISSRSKARGAGRSKADGDTRSVVNLNQPVEFFGGPGFLNVESFIGVPRVVELRIDSILSESVLAKKK